MTVQGFHQNGSAMLPETRRRRLRELIARQGYATLDELVKTLNVSESTARRDLEALELTGAIRRTHGGAVASDGSDHKHGLPAFDDRTHTAMAEKRAIGEATAALIENGDSILLDGGTTTLEVARALLARDIHTQIVTNSLPIAQLVASNPRTDLILIGGSVYPRTGVALGPLSIAMMREIRVRVAILGAGGIMADGVYNSNLLLVETERRMMACGQEVVITADRTKFGRAALARLCGWDEVTRLVCDVGAPEDQRATVAAAGVIVHAVETAGNDGATEPKGDSTDERTEA